MHSLHCPEPVCNTPLGTFEEHDGHLRRSDALKRSHTYLLRLRRRFQMQPPDLTNASHP